MTSQDYVININDPWIYYNAGVLNLGSMNPKAVHEGALRGPLDWSQPRLYMHHDYSRKREHRFL